MNPNTKLIHVSDLPKDLPEIEDDPRLVMTKDLESGGMVQLEDPPFSFFSMVENILVRPETPETYHGQGAGCHWTRIVKEA